jgi:tripartite ATP-independent transporter DctM subunit
VFATATGIVGAVVTLMGLLALPAMLRAGYDVKLSAGAITAGGCLGILIPPSVMLILYGATAGVSVVKLYAGAFLPGLLLAALYVVYVIARAILDPKLAPKLPSEESDVPFFDVVKMLITSFFPLTVLILGVLGSIVFGLATPSEAAAIGSLGGLLLAIGYRQLTWQRMKESVFLTARTSAMVCWLFVGSALFSAVFALLGGQEVINNWVLSLGLTKVQFLLLSQAIIFLLGWPLEWTEIIVIFMPIFIPLVAHFQIDPLFFGILVALNLQTAFLSPPVAMAAFYLKGVAPPHVTLNQIFAGMMPFMVIQVFAMFLLYVWPEIALWLPNYLYR